MNDNNILLLHVSYGRGLIVEFGPAILAFFALGIVTYLLCSRYFANKKSEWDLVEAEIPFGQLGRVKIKPNHEDIQIAHKAWVELATRKAGLPFDEDHDVIVEVYDSWYELFRETRNLAKQIPAEKVRKSENTRELVRLLVDSLNMGLRPHLTEWQAKFRRWYNEAINAEGNKCKTPQEIQKTYPEYSELILDLKKVNAGLVGYTEFIRKIAQG